MLGPAAPPVLVTLALLSQSGDGPLLGVRINDPLSPGQDVNVSRVGPDGLVFHVVTEPVFDAGRLYVERTDGAGRTTPLTPQLAPGRDFQWMEVSPDGLRAVYVADQDTPGVFELYSVPADASQAPVKLNGPLVQNGDVFPFFLEFTPDSARVVFMADAFNDGILELFSAPTDGGGPAVALGSPVRGTPQLTSDGAHVVFEWFGLLGVPADGSAAPTRIDGLPGTPELEEFELSPDGQWVVFRTTELDGGGGNTYTIRSVPVVGGAAPNTVFDTVSQGLSTLAPQFLVTSDSSRVVHRTEPDPFSTSTHEVLSAPIDGSAPAVRLSPGLASGIGAGPGVALAPGGRVLFTFRESPFEPPILFVAPQDGSTPALALTGPGPWPDHQNWATTSERVLFLGESGGVDELYSVPLDGSASPTRLNAPLVAGGNVFNGLVDAIPSFHVTPDERHVVYLADQETDEVFEAWITPVAGGPVRKLNGRLAGSRVAFQAFTADSRYLVYSAQQSVVGQYELYASTLAEPLAGQAGSPLPDALGAHR